MNAIFGAGLSVPQVALPLGISFYTFKAISYVLDCYWETVQVQKHYPKFLLYLSLFPHVISGPIVRYSTIENEIDNRTTTLEDVWEGSLRIIIGLAKKVIIANNLWSIVDTFFGKDIAGLSVFGTWYTIIAYSLYVYFDFSGYSDIAIGLSRLFGFGSKKTSATPSCVPDRRGVLAALAFRSAPSSATTCSTCRFSAKTANTRASSSSGSAPACGTAPGTSPGLYYGCFMLFEQKARQKRMKKWPVWCKHIYTKLVIIIGFGIFFFEDLGQLGQFFLNISGISMLTNGAPLADPITWSRCATTSSDRCGHSLQPAGAAPKSNRISSKTKSDAIALRSGGSVPFRDLPRGSSS